jgi:hypothetical protein
VKSSMRGKPPSPRGTSLSAKASNPVVDYKKTCIYGMQINIIRFIMRGVLDGEVNEINSSNLP